MITIYKGDDTGGNFGKKLTLEVTTDQSLEGATLVFEFFNIRREFSGVKTGDQCEIHLSHNETMMLPVGTHRGRIYIVDSAGKIRTLNNSLSIRVTTNLAECYDDEGIVKVLVHRCVDFSRIVNVPKFVKTINEKEPDENGNITITIPDEAGFVAVVDGKLIHGGKEITVRDLVTLMQSKVITLYKDGQYYTPNFKATTNDSAVFYTVADRGTGVYFDELLVSGELLTTFEHNLITGADFFAKYMSTEAVKTAETFAAGQMNNKANGTTLIVPFSVFKGAGKVTRIRVYGADAAGGGYQGEVYMHILVKTANNIGEVAVSTEPVQLALNSFNEFKFDEVAIPECSSVLLMFSRYEAQYVDSGANVRFGLVGVDASKGYGFARNGSTFPATTVFAPILEIDGILSVQEQLDKLRNATCDCKPTGWKYGETVQAVAGATTPINHGDVVICDSVTEGTTLLLPDEFDELLFVTKAIRSAFVQIYKKGATFFTEYQSEGSFETFVLGTYSFYAVIPRRIRKIGDNEYFVSNN